jgi:hypothetical protein
LDGPLTGSNTSAPYGTYARARSEPDPCGRDPAPEAVALRMPCDYLGPGLYRPGSELRAGDIPASSLIGEAQRAASLAISKSEFGFALSDSACVIDSDGARRSFAPPAWRNSYAAHARLKLVQKPDQRRFWG